MNFIKQSVQRLSEYYVLQDFSVVKLNQNESPYDVPIEIKKEILRRLEGTNWNRYCENRPTRLINAIADYTGFPPDGIVAGNASNEIIQTIFTAVCQKGDRVVSIAPGFSVYPRMAQIYELNFESVPLLDDFEFDVQKIIKAAQDAKMVILSSPNNPTGTAISMGDVISILDNSDCLFVLDEAYFEFHGQTAQSFLQKYENLVLIRTFSKAFSLAGLRLGYLLAQPHVAKEFEKAKLPFSVGIFQQIAGEVLLNNQQLIKNNIDLICEQREILLGEVSQLSGVRTVPTCANFFLFKIDNVDAKMAYELFYKKGVLLRYFESERLRDYLRVTIGKPEENEIFLKTLKEIAGA